MKRLQALFVVATVAMVSAPVWAVPIFDVDFQSDTVGSPPVVAAVVVGGTSTHPTTASVTGTTNTRLVQDGYEALGGSGDKVLVISDTSAVAGNTFILEFNADAADAISSGSAVYSWDMLASSTAPRAGNLFMTFRTAANKTIAQIIIAVGPSSTESMKLTTFTSSGGFVDTASYVFSRGVVQHIDFAMDMDANTVDVYVNSTLQLSASIAYLSGINLPTDNVARWQFGAGNSSATYALDNFVFDVPEPASIALLGLGGALVLVHGKRR